MNYICLDIESTGFDPEKDEIIEFAAVRFNGNKIIDKITALTKPKCEIPKIVQNITSINDEMVADKKPFTDYIDELSEFIGTDPIVGHNINFDIDFLRMNGLPLGNKQVDTLPLSLILLPKQPSYSLETLCKVFKVSHVDAHRALDDVMANIEFFNILLDHAKRIPTSKLEEICYYCKRSDWGASIVFERELKERKGKARKFIIPNLPRNNDNDIETTSFSVPPLSSEVIEDIFSEDGVLKKTFGKTYEPRAEQITMSHIIADGLSKGHHTICEAGTGTGKSLAYLMPAALYALSTPFRVVVATYTLNLQEQLAQKDIPLVKKAILKLCPELREEEIKTVVLKGRSQYLSLVRFAEFLEKDYFEEHELTAAIKILLWLEHTKTGDREEVELRNKENTVWSQLCCSEGFCPHQAGGPSYPCFLMKARAEAKEAHVIITNHQLLLQDLCSQMPILPSYHHAIIDEAHNIDDAATRALSFTLSLRDFERTLDHTRNVLRKVATFTKPNLFIKEDLSGNCIELADRLETMKNSLTILYGMIGSFYEYHQQGQSSFDLILHKDSEDFTSWKNIIAGFEKARNAFTEVCGTLVTIKEGVENQAKLFEDLEQEMMFALNGEDLKTLKARIKSLITEPDPGMIRVIKMTRDGDPVLKAIPISIAPFLEEHFFDKKKSISLTSATLSVEHNFGYIRDQLGLTKNVTELHVPSPFAYNEQCNIIVADDMPQPSHPSNIPEVVKALKKIIEKRKGRILVLLTAKTSINNCYHALHDWCKANNVNLLAQGITGGRGKILHSYKHSPENSIILGLNSFWEGVDLSGDLLTTLVIQKLPFDPPVQPIHAIRRSQFKNPFNEYDVPRAILKFKQGFGRLIRSHHDEGHVVILDSRIVQKSYGKSFLDSLPDGIPITHTEKEHIAEYL